MSFTQDAIFWVEVDKISPNPYQPRREFDEARLHDLADSIRQYGILQPLTVTRREIYREDGGISVEYELIAGERRLRASKIARLSTVPVIIKDMRDEEANDQLRLELAIIENLQREDINAVDRARAFNQLAEEFGLKHSEIAKKVGKSREYVSNSIRILALPEHMLQALMDGKISEGHTRPLLMVGDKPEEQETLFKEIVLKKMTVRKAEQIGRRIAHEKARKPKKALKPEFRAIEETLSESLGTRVHIEHREKGGFLVIDFFTDDDVHMLAKMISEKFHEGKNALLNKHLQDEASLAPTTSQAEQQEKQSEESAPSDGSQTQEEQSQEVHKQSETPENLSDSVVVEVREEVVVETSQGGSEQSPPTPQPHNNVGENTPPQMSSEESEQDNIAIEESKREEEKEENNNNSLYSISNFSI